MASAPQRDNGKGSGRRPAEAAPEPTPAALDSMVATAIMRNAYTRERHYFLMRMILVLGACLFVSCACNMFMATRPPVYRYFATDRDGKLTEMTPVNEPIGSQAQLGTWLTDSLVEAYSFDFANYRRQLSGAEGNFTPEGWKGFEKALRDSGTLESVIVNKYVTVAVPTSAPVLVDRGIINGRYAWKFQIPMLVTYESAQRTISTPLMINAIVIRQPETEHPRGLGIAQIIAQ